MSITTERKDAPGKALRNGVAALVVGGSLGVGCVGFLLWKVFRPGKAEEASHRSPGEARIAAKAEAARDRAEAGAGRMRQEEVGTGYQFDAQGNYVPPQVDPSSLPDNQPLVTLEPMPSRPTYYEPPRREEFAEGDPNAAREKREARKEERADLRGSMLGYTTSVAASWAGRRAQREEKGAATPEEAQAQANIRSMERLTALAERAMAGGDEAPPKPAEKEAQPVGVGEVGDMRIRGGSGPDETVREGKFLDCVLINRVESDIAESPVMAQVARDFVSLDGKQVLVPSGAKLMGTAGRIQSLQQARLYLKFHKIVFPRRPDEEVPKVAWFPSRAFPAMDALGSLGVKDRVNRHLMLQFGAALALGVVDGLAAQAEGPNAGTTPTARDAVIQRSSQNFGRVADAVIQRYANVVPTVTLREGTKLKVYFTQDVLLTPYMAIGDRAWTRERR